MTLQLHHASATDANQWARIDYATPARGTRRCAFGPRRRDGLSFTLSSICEPLNSVNGSASTRRIDTLESFVKLKNPNGLSLDDGQNRKTTLEYSIK